MNNQEIAKASFMKAIKTDQMIHKLSTYDAENFDMGDFYHLFRYGIKGYEDMDKEELSDLYKAIFEETDD